MASTARDPDETMSSSPTNSELLDVSGASTDFVRTNPTMDRIRLTLKQQLVQTRDRIRLEVIEQEDALKEAKREREDAGIELYGVQQQLSRIQSSLKTIDKRYDAVSTERVEGQKKVVEAKEVYAEKQKISESLRKVAAKRQEELEAILEKISQAKKYNEAMKSEVAVTRTVANKTNEDLKTRAKDKLTQDTYIDSLNSQVTRLEDDIALTEAQLKAQKEQSADADMMIRETSGALEKLASEQRRLVQQWNSSVVALGRRDQALSAATNALKKVQDSIKDLKSENSRLVRDIEVLRENNEGLKTLGDRLDNEIVFTENCITKAQSNLGRLSEKFEMLQEALQNTTQEERDITTEISKIESEMSSMNQKCELLIRERHAIEEKIATARHEQANMSKAAQNLAKKEKAVLQRIHDKEIESATIMNEIARLEIDRLNTLAHNSQLEEKLKEELSALKQAETQIDEYEGEIKRFNNEIEKKTKRVAQLNREYNKMVDACDDEEPLGPFEATIKSLSNEIEKESKEIAFLQKEWQMRQTELIKTISKTNLVQEKDGESTGRLSILRQKALRLVQEIHSNESSLKSIEMSTRGLHADIIRLNDLIEQNTRRRMEYANKIAVNAMEFERELAELDEQSTRLEVQVVDAESNRHKLLSEMKEADSQIQAWEKKIQIEKETQAELHTSKNAIDAKGMEKEIQRMKHRLDSLVRTQEQLLRDMELAIHKRQDIAVKHKNTKNKGNDSNQNLTKGELAKKVEMARTQLKRLDDNIREASTTVTKTREDLAAIRLVLGDTNAKYNSVAKQAKSLQEEVDAKEFERTRLLSLSELQNELLQRYESLSKGEVPPVKASISVEFAVEKELVKAKTNMDKVSNIISGLSLKFDQYEEVFDRMNMLASSDVVV